MNEEAARAREDLQKQAQDIMRLIGLLNPDEREEVILDACDQLVRQGRGGPHWTGVADGRRSGCSACRRRSGSTW
jgi:hypothetical protein